MTLRNYLKNMNINLSQPLPKSQGVTIEDVVKLVERRGTDRNVINTLMTVGISDEKNTVMYLNGMYDRLTGGS